MQGWGVSGYDSRLGLNFNSGPELSMSITECVFQRSIKNVNLNIGKLLDSVPLPSHLLLLRHSFGNDFVDRRFGEAG